MPSIHIRNVDDAIVARLKERARTHNRSLQGELRQILKEAALGPSAGAEGPVRRKLELTTVRVGSSSDFGRGDIYGDDGR